MLTDSFVLFRPFVNAFGYMCFWHVYDKIPLSATRRDVTRVFFFFFLFYQVVYRWGREKYHEENTMCLG